MKGLKKKVKKNLTNAVIYGILYTMKKAVLPHRRGFVENYVTSHLLLKPFLF